MLNFPVPNKSLSGFQNFPSPSKLRWGFPDFRSSVIKKVVSALWTPAEITTALWLDANDSSTITLDGSSNVEQWDDKSGNLRHVAQSTPASRPAVSSAELNGLDVLSFSSDYLQDIAQLHSGPWSVFAVAKSNGPSGVQQILCQDTNTTGERIAQYLRDNSGNPETLAFTSVSAFAATKSATVTDWLIYGGVTSSTEITAYINGVSGTAVSVSGTLATGSVNFQVGARLRLTTPENFWNGLIAEIVFVSSDVDVDTRQYIEGYLAWKWGLEANLPSDHPYKNSLPLIE